MKYIKIAATTALFVIMLFVPSFTASAASCGETVRQNTEAELKAIDYKTNETIVKLLAPIKYSLADIDKKKREIAKREGISNFTTISDEKAIKELNQDNIKIMSFDRAFKDAQDDIGNTIQRIIDSTSGAENKGPDTYTNKIRQNKEKLLLGLAYLNRLYDFNMGEHNVKDFLLYETTPFLDGEVEDVLDWLIYIGGAGNDKLKISNSASVFGWGKLFWPVTTSANLEVFLEDCRKKWIPDTPMNEWFLRESRAHIIEKPSSWDGKTPRLFKRLHDNPTFCSHILPLLTVSEDSVYVIANSATITYGIVDCYINRSLKETNPTNYAKLRKEFMQQLEQAAKQQTAFIDFWYRIAKPDKKSLLSSNRIVFDSLRIKSDSSSTSPEKEWSAKLGEDASSGVREFFTPLNLWASYMFADGAAEGDGIRYYLSKALTERGLSTYAHELTHLLVSKMMMGGYGPRDGMLAEVYTRGMFEPYEGNDPPAFNLNLIYDRLSSNERFHNGEPERFQEETDLKNYMSGILDVVYTLDYAEAEVILEKSPEEKKKWFHKLEQIQDSANRYNQGEAGSKHNLDSVGELTLDEATALNTIDDLIRDSIIVSRYEVGGTKTTGTLPANGYYVVPLFSANYAGVQNDFGVSGDVMIRRQAFELLAEYGYYDGMVPYISNQYKDAAKSDGELVSDKYVLKKIFGGTYETMADFKKAMFQKRIEKTNKLKPVTITWDGRSVTINTFEELCLLMKKAVESDLIKVSVTPDGNNNIRAQATEVERLKQEIFKAYLLMTEDFKESIYGTGQTPVQPPAPGGDTEDPKPNQPANPGDAKPNPPANPGGSNSNPSDKPSGGASTGGSSGAYVNNTKPSLLLCRVSSAKTSQTIRWNAVDSADGYEIYGAKNNGKFKCLGTVSGDFKNWKHNKLKKGTQYKYYVTAYKSIGGQRVVLSKSLPVYGITKGGKYGNPSKISEKRSRINIKRGKKIKLRIKVKGKKMKKSGKKVRYVSANPSVAKVSKKGVISGKKRGTCTVYCITQNGLTKKIKVKVK